MYVLPKLSIAHSLESFMFESILSLKPLKYLWLIDISISFHPRSNLHFLSINGPFIIIFK